MTHYCLQFRNREEGDVLGVTQDSVFYTTTVPLRPVQEPVVIILDLTSFVPKLNGRWGLTSCSFRGSNRTLDRKVKFGLYLVIDGSSIAHYCNLLVKQYK